MSEPVKLDELIRTLLPTGALPGHLRPVHLLDESVEPPRRVAEKVHALRALMASGGREEPLTGRIGSSRDVAEYFGSRLRGRSTESVWVAGLNIRNRVLLTHCVALGGVAGCGVQPMDVFRPLLLNSCATLILVHNHPSGDPEPSDEDAAFTGRIREAGELLGVRLLDHVIIGAEGYFSFLDAGLLTR